ncbi:MAG: hypothetical protein U0271_02775 [Polyangiaceae bacterium]
MNKSGLFAPALHSLDARTLRRSLPPRLTADVGTNQQILDACQQFYAAHFPAVDACTTSGVAFAQDPAGQQVIGGLQAQDWTGSSLTPGMATGASAAGASPLFQPALANVNADALLTTIGFGVSAGAQFFIGGAGGAGVIADVAKREPAMGMGYAVGELGFDVNLELNIEIQLFNQLPSQLAGLILGLAVEAYFGLGVRLAIMVDLQLEFRGFAIGIGVGFGGGATVFGGNIWTFS